jgi:hypothetical protein
MVGKDAIMTKCREAYAVPQPKLAHGLKIEEIFKPSGLTPPPTLGSRNSGPVPPCDEVIKVVNSLVSETLEFWLCFSVEHKY